MASRKRDLSGEIEGVERTLRDIARDFDFRYVNDATVKARADVQASLQREALRLIEISLLVGEFIGSDADDDETEAYKRGVADAKEAENG